ncbi:TonB-dependent receptor [Puteibacter caeruleilacunae]|nr:TonB-dependent receptor [Puteibacter caeruleilacunae]
MSKTYSIMKRSLQYYRIIVMLTGIFLVSQTIVCAGNYSEEDKKEVTGKVVDEGGNPLPGVTVAVVDKAIGTVTDLDGKYLLSIPATTQKIQFSFIGMETLDENVSGRKVINVTLKESTIGLEEVVAIGYGSMKKKDLTGSVASVKSEDITKNAAATLDQGLQGKVAGVYVSQNSATPGGGVSVRIRGIGGFNNSEPLYVVDGVPIAASGSEKSNPLSSINPNDIESMDILKDAASAAIYGARAANGVIIITTKRGKKGKGVVAYNGYYGVQKIYNPIKTMTGSQYASYINDLRATVGAPQVFDNPASFGEGTDWVDEITQVAPMQDHQVSLSGGGEKGSYLLSLGFMDQEGTTIGTSFERITVRSNGDRQINDWLKVGSNISFSKSKQRAVGGSRENFNSIITSAYSFYPTIPVYDENGDYSATDKNGFYKPVANPLFIAERTSYPPVTNRFMGNLYAEIKVLENLKFKSAVSYTYNSNHNKGISDTYDLGAALQDRQYVSRSQSYSSNMLIENTISYDFDLNGQKLQMVLGQSFEDYDSENLSVGTGYADNGHYVVDANGVEVPSIGNNVQEYSMSSFFGRVFYNYDERFLITANFRADGSSRFGANNKWGYFPSVSAGWRVSEEDFFPENSWISSMKLRAGWGQVGNNEIGNYSFSAPMQSGFGYPFGDVAGTRLNGMATTRIANPDLKWETVTQYSFGLDASLFDGKMNVVAEYFNKNHSDMLVPVQQSGVTGISYDFTPGTMTQNIAELSNSGIELAVDYRGNLGEVGYSIGGNITTFNNEVKKVGGKGYYETFPFQGTSLVRTQEGRELGEFYGFVSDGLFQSADEVTSHAFQTAGTAPGDIRFKDLSGPEGTPDGKIDDYDKTFIGSPVPEFTYGLNTEFDYKNWTLTAQFTGSYGNDIANLTKRSLLDVTRGENKMDYTPWSVSNSTSIYPRAHANDPNKNMRFSDYYVEKGSFFRCKLIQVGYTLPSDMLKSFDISRLRIYGSIQNPFTITNYSGVNPEVGSQGGSNTKAGIDHFLYPLSRVYLLGVNLSF